MAPVEPELHNSNFQPIAITAGHATANAVLLAIIARGLERAYDAIPVAQETRIKQTRRVEAIKRFASFALFSLVVTTYLAFQRRYTSYQVWEQTRQTGNSLWSEGWWRGWYANTEEDTPLGSWWADSNIYSEPYQAWTATSRAYWWAQQYTLGWIVWSVFLGVEGWRRNISWISILAYALLSQYGGLSLTQSVFSVHLLLTPVSEPEEHEDEPTGQAGRWIYAVLPAVPCFLEMALHQSDRGSVMSHALCAAGIVIPQVIADAVGKKYDDVHAGNRAQSTIFGTLGLVSLLFNAISGFLAVADNAPDRTYYDWNSLWSMHSPREQRTVFERMSLTLQRLLGALGDHPAVQMIGVDAILSGIVMALWAYERGLNWHDMLRCGGLPWLKHSESDTTGHHEPDMQPADELVVNGISTADEPRKRRGRPPKTPAKATSTSRRATRSSDGSDHDYLPTAGKRAEVARMQHDEEHDEGLVEDTEALALTWGLCVLGGLASASAGVLGAEVCRN